MPSLRHQKKFTVRINFSLQSINFLQCALIFDSKAPVFVCKSSNFGSCRNHDNFNTLTASLTSQFLSEHVAHGKRAMREASGGGEGGGWQMSEHLFTRKIWLQRDGLAYGWGRKESTFLLLNAYFIDCLFNVMV